MKVRKEKTHIGLIIQHTRTVELTAELALRPSLRGSTSSYRCYAISYALSQRPGRLGYVQCTMNYRIT